MADLNDVNNCDLEGRWKNTNLKGQNNTLSNQEQRIGLYDLSRALGDGCRTQEQSLISLRVSSRWLCLMPAKCSRDSKLLNRVLMTRGGREEELYITE